MGKPLGDFLIAWPTPAMRPFSDLPGAYLPTVDPTEMDVVALEEEIHLIEQRLLTLHPEMSPEARAAIESWIEGADRWRHKGKMQRAVVVLKEELEDLRALEQAWSLPGAFCLARPLFKSEEDLYHYQDLHSFHVVEWEVLLRGNQPTERGLEWLKNHGVRTIVNLRAEDSSEGSAVERLGMHYVHLPVVDHEPPTLQQVDSFLSVLSEAHRRTVFVHCLGGAGRTGLFVACWRINRGWAVEEAIKEARLFELKRPGQVQFIEQFARTRRRFR